ncbi:MAG: nucleotidyltransferase family protein [Burkholderiales bacterium]|nr:nucleotidyltransferase family protein [Burkholderiales bacterium]
MAAPVRGILLAAGASRRFGANKLLHTIDGMPIACRAGASLAAALPGALAVTRSGSPLAPMLADLGLTVVACPRADDGMGASLACAVAAAGDAAGWVVALADMPFILPASHARVARALAAGADLVAAAHRGVRGHPVGIGARFRDALLALEGDAGARHIVREHAALLRLVECDDPGVLRDIDTPADLR